MLPLFRERFQGKSSKVRANQTVSLYLAMVADVVVRNSCVKGVIGHLRAGWGEKAASTLHLNTYVLREGNGSGANFSHAHVALVHADGHFLIQTGCPSLTFPTRARFECVLLALTLAGIKTL